MGEFLWAILSELLNIVVGKANSCDTRFIKLLRRLALFLGAIGILLLFASSFVEDAAPLSQSIRICALSLVALFFAIVPCILLLRFFRKTVPDANHFQTTSNRFEKQEDSTREL